MASTFQPPIHLDPNQDAGQQTAFINQNFQTLASALETNSMRIVRGPLTMQVSSTGPAINWTTVAHGLDFTPIVFGWLNNSNVSSITANGSLMLPTWSGVTIDIINNYMKFQTWIQILSDPTNIYGLLLNATNAPVTPLTVTYYLYQLPSQ